MHRNRNAKIIATLGPASADPEVIKSLFVAGADVFRLNFSHGDHEDHAVRVKTIRDLEQRTHRPIGILLDLQGPKLRVGVLRGGETTLREGTMLRLDLDPEPGDGTRVGLPHPEVFQALRPDTMLLIDDGKIRLHVKNCGANFADAQVQVGGTLSDHKGLNVPDVVLPISPLTDKDRRDLEFGLALGVDWVAASFIQRPEDLQALSEIIGDQAFVMSKLEKPAAIEHLDEIIERSDGVMVARGDLGVELPLENVPRLQKQIIRRCRDAGKPVVVATQMLESMISAPLPTRAEVSDVAAAVYDGADAVMLSAETAVGQFPTEAVSMMDRVITRVERDPHYRVDINANVPAPRATAADAICESLRQIAHTLPVAVTVTYTSSGSSALRAARERPEASVLTLTPHQSTARRLALVWGIHAVKSTDIQRVEEMVDRACQTALHEGFADVGEILVIVAGMPFGVSGTTNLIRIARVREEHAAV